MVDTCGKRIGDNLWVHKSGVGTLPDSDKTRVAAAALLARSKGFSYDVVKLAPGAVSFLKYPGFFTESHPKLVASLLVQGGQAQLREYGENPPVLHRIEEMLAPNHPERARLAARTQGQERRGYFSGADKSRIGTLAGHRARLRQIGGSH